MDSNNDKLHSPKLEPDLICDRMNIPIENRIFTLRNKPVMIDRDLAELYGVETKRLNEQVKRNIDRFPESFRFHLLIMKKSNWSQIATG